MIPKPSNQTSRLIDDNSKFTIGILDPVLESYQDKKSITSDLVNSPTENKVKPIPSRIDYNFFNYCSICELKYPKSKTDFALSGLQSESKDEALASIKDYRS